MTRRPPPLFWVGLASALGCSEAGQGSPTSGLGEARAAVVGGELSGPGIEDAVLLLHSGANERELVCSAALVAKNLVVTARHCVSHLVEGLFSCTTRGELIEADPGAGRLGMHFPAESFEFFGGRPPHEQPLARGKQVLSTLSETICVNDIAFVVLDREVDLPVLPLRFEGRARRGEPVTLVGYGLDETMDPRDPFDLRSQERTRKTGLTIAAVGPETADEVTTAPPRMIVLEGPSGCLGDSGGPLIDSETHALLGIYSLLDGESCVAANLRHLFGHLPSFRALVDAAFVAAGAEPLVERAPNEGGAGGDAGAAGTNAAAGGNAGTPEAAGGAGGEPGVSPSEGGAGGFVGPGEGGAGGDPTPTMPGRRSSSGGCRLALVSDQPRPTAFFVALVFAGYAVRRRRLSAGCRADLLRGAPQR